MDGDRQLQLMVDGRQVEVPDDGASLCEVLRDRLGITTVKDGCSPQGQCGCCTVLVDGRPRVSCVTPARRVRDRSIVTVADLPDAATWAAAFTATGASQCGFCTPGIICRLSAIDDPDDATVRDALKAHLCRCTGWQTIVEAARLVSSATSVPARDLDAAGVRATIEGGTTQHIGPEVALGHGGFADDTAPGDALVAVRGADGSWHVAETLSEARRRAAKIQGRRTTVAVRPPLAAPPGAWDATLATSWTEPAYLETDAAWCLPGGEPASPLANGGAFGGKVASEVGRVARELADRHGRAVRVLFAREDTVRFGAKRPPVAGGARADGTGVLRIAATPHIASAVEAMAPGLAVETVTTPGPPTSAALRAAGWAEAIALLAGARGSLEPVRRPSGAVADAVVDARGIRVQVRCGEPLDEVLLRSYCIGAAHMAYSWVTSEGLAVDAEGEVQDLTVRSFGVVRAVDTPPIDVEIVPETTEPVNGSDAVFAAVAAATWLAEGCPPAWPTRATAG